ncbi:unnamed protein product [Nezara viridula]|uniref:Uncharacterized protein n=1 Tax=Nezara viridula TaxID=85310 RepID=A0A9P0H148_NEZVI|nr:unnamed protein product [Nezara viridula]
MVILYRPKGQWEGNQWIRAGIGLRSILRLPLSRSETLKDLLSVSFLPGERSPSINSRPFIFVPTPRYTIHYPLSSIHYPLSSILYPPSSSSMMTSLELLAPLVYPGRLLLSPIGADGSIHDLSLICLHLLSANAR